MRLSALSALVPVLRRALKRRQTHPNYLRLLGLVAGVYALTVCHLFLATFGTSLSAVTAVVVAIAVGVEFGWKPAASTAGGWQHWGLHLGLAGWMFALPYGLQAAMAVIGTIPLEVMVAPGRLVLFECLAAVVLIAPAVFALARLPLTAPVFPVARPSQVNEKRNSKPRITSQKGNVEMLLVLAKPFRFLAERWRARRRRIAEIPMAKRLLPIFLRSLVVGFIVSMLLLAPVVGIHVSALTIACLSVLAVLVAMVGRNNSKQHNSVRYTADTDAPNSSRFEVITTGIAIGLFGATSAVLMRMLQQLAASAGYLVYAQGLALIVGLAWGVRFARTRDAAVVRMRSCLIAAATAGLSLLCFPLLLEASLWINVYTVEPLYTMFARGGLVFLVLMPLGFAWGRSVSTTSAGTPHAVSLFPFVAGFLLVRWVGFAMVSVPNLVVVSSIACVLLASSRWLIARIRFRGSNRVPAASRPRTGSADSAGDRSTHESSTPSVGNEKPNRPLRGRHAPGTREPATGWTRRVAIAGALTVVAVAPFVRSFYDPVLTAKMLFGTDVAVAKMQGYDSNLLPHLDEARALDVREGESGTYCVWRFRGTQMQIRENGVPKALVSTRTSICPQYSAEVMPAALPLMLHESPRRVMILGVAGGVSLSTTLSFPIQEVTCVARDPELLATLRRHVWTESREQPEADSRLSLFVIDPAVAVACRGKTYDVIVSSPDQSALLRSTPYFTRGFYQRVSSRLSEDGIFCQRFQQMDYGPGPLRTAAKTLQSVFQNVVAIEIAAGEMALLATNSEQGLVREGLVERMQSPHVRTVLSRIGWDWSLPLNLTACSHNGLQTIIDAEPTKLNTASNGQFAFRLPQEMMRWAPKHQELLAAIAPVGTRFLESDGIDGNDEVLLRRLSELAGRQKLRTKFPDQWWAYRKSLREQLKQRPRTLIKSVRNGGGKRFHPEDQRRMDYFKYLARATRNPTPDKIRKVVEFTESYDPLVSYFAHAEIAALFKRGRPKNPRAELWHRLHTIYYAHPRDRSVRDVSRALVLLASHDNVVDSAADRWDHLNGLLQTLKSRWITRGLVAPRKAQIVLNDIEDSLEAAEAAFSTMDKLHASVGVTSAAWSARKRVLQNGLTHPLESYRAQLLKHHHYERAKIKAMLRKLEEESQPKPEPLDPKKKKKYPTVPAIGPRKSAN